MYLALLRAVMRGAQGAKERPRLLGATQVGRCPLSFRRNARSLTLYDAATSEYGMAVALTWFIPGMCLVTAYFAWLYASMPERYELPSALTTLAQGGERLRASNTARSIVWKAAVLKYITSPLISTPLMWVGASTA